MLKAVIFDLNGVFIQSPRLSDRFFEKYSVPPEKFLPVLTEVMGRVRLPNAGNAFEYWKPYLMSWDCYLSRDDFFTFWFSAESECRELTDLARKMKEKGLRLFILSNNFQERADYYQKNFPFLDELFEKVYYSWQTGFVKPSREALELVLSENNLSADECIYFDDSEKNTRVAEEVGLQSFLFEGAEQVERVVRESL